VKLVYRLTNKELDPKIILFAIFFSNLIDLFHFDFYRTISHSLMGTVVIGCSVLFFFRLSQLIKKSETMILLVAVLTHIPADFFFSTYYFFYPFDLTAYSIFSFNSYEDIVIEIILGFIFLITIILSRDLHKIRLYLIELLREAKNYTQLKKRSYQSIIILFIYIGFILFIFGQFYVYYLLNQQLLNAFYWYIIVFSFIWLLFIGVLVSNIYFSGNEKETEFQT
jgi:hypothetical protein